METVNFLAQLFGFSLILVCLSFLISQKNARNIFHLVEDEKLLLLVGIINIVLGIALVLTYNIWDSSWKVIVTVLEWLIIVKGSLILFLPDVTKKIIENFKSKMSWMPVMFFAGVLLGCLLVYFGMSF